METATVVRCMPSTLDSLQGGLMLTQGAPRPPSPAPSPRRCPRPHRHLPRDQLGHRDLLDALRRPACCLRKSTNASVARLAEARVALAWANRTTAHSGPIRGRNVTFGHRTRRIGRSYRHRYEPMTNQNSEPPGLGGCSASIARGAGPMTDRRGMAPGQAVLSSSSHSTARTVWVPRTPSAQLKRPAGTHG
jgi:hypothetical protein